MEKRSLKIRAFLMALILIVMMPLAVYALDDDDTEGGASSVPVPASPENGIPLIVINVDECELYTDDKGDTYGSIQDMNDSLFHTTRCKGNVDILVPEGYGGGYGESVLNVDSVTGNLKLSYIRGRGNSTWFDSKKPYKIKFDKKQNLFGMGKSKEWALMANASDITLMKNRLASWLGIQMGMPFTPQMIPVDVVMKGSYGSEIYLGSYCLSELVDVEENRVNINEDGGYLISIYNEGQNSDEPRNAVFTTKAGMKYYIRVPSYEGDDSTELTEEQNDQREYISSYMQSVEDLIMEPEVIDEDIHNEIADKMDLISAADYWLIQEFSRNGDAYDTGSTYLYKDRDGKLCWGPLWDFDIAWGSQNDESDNIDDYEDAVTGFNCTWSVWISALREKDPYFVELLKERWALLGGDDGLIGELTSKGGIIDQYKAEAAASQVQNGLLWPDMTNIAETADQYDLAVQKLKKWIDQRRAWIDANLDTIHKATVTITYVVDGNVVKTEKLKVNSDEFDPPEVPEIEGKAFLGWLCEEKNALLGDFSVEEDIEVVPYYIDNADVVNPTAIYLPRHEDWADIQGEVYDWVTDTFLVPDEVTFRDITWSSSDETIATVAQDGYVNLKGTGDVVITATHRSGMTASYTLHIYDSKVTPAKEVTGVKAEDDKITMETGEFTQVRWILEPDDDPLQNTRVLYQSSDESVAYVDDLGVVRANDPGTAVITVFIVPIGTSSDPFGEEKTYEATFTVTVKGSANPVPAVIDPEQTDPASNENAAPAKTAIKLKGTKIKSMKRSSKAIRVKWKKQKAMVAGSHISGYQIQAATNKKFTQNRKTVTVKGYKKTSKKIRKLKGNKWYYVRVRTFKTMKGERYYSSWSKVRTVKTKR